MKKVVLLLLVLVLMSAGVIAEEKYSFENAEALKPLIEWRDYGQESFAEAAIENKPIFLLLTAPSWCYWCQVYESEDYLFNPEVIKVINEQTIPIYVDADQRTDLTRKFLEGGWPSTTIMTPTGDRIMGYSGPRPVPFMVTNVVNAKTFVDQQAFSNSVELNYQTRTIPNITNTDLYNIQYSYQIHLLQNHDQEFGGFGTGQKFPQPLTLHYALEQYEETRDPRFLAVVERTLQNQYTNVDELQTNYNLFDPVEGGFHRYGVDRDWSPPHYEKMLYDNARLLQTYLYLREINPNNVLVDEVIEKTHQYMITEYYDGAGFYANTDVNGEDAYYGLVDRPGKARVEPTKFTNWNSEAILTYLYYYQLTQDEYLAEVVKNSTDFFIEEMISEEDGALNYYKFGEKGLQGSLLSNAYLLLALVEVYDEFEDPKYLEAAQLIADYSLDNLYDWNSAGFFERNSKDIEDYAPGEALDTNQPMQENAIMALGMLKLYNHTRNFEYLTAGVNTIKIHVQTAQPFDRGYHLIKATELIREQDLLAVEGSYQSYISTLQEERLENFWLNELLEEQNFEVDTSTTDTFDGSLLLLGIVALLAGLLSFISPCTLPIIPAYIAYMLHQKKKKQATVFFFLGLGLTFMILGMSASLLGNFLREHLGTFNIIAGGLLILFGLLMFFNKNLKGFNIQQKKPMNHAQTFFFGMVFGISWTPCVGPILAGILILASTTTTIFTGGLLLLLYAIGLGVPLYLVSSHLDSLKKVSWLKGKEMHIGSFKIHSTQLISAVLLILLGILILSGGLIFLNKLVGTTAFQQWIIGIEDLLLRMI